MAWAPDYATVAELKAMLGIPTATTTYDAELATVLGAASRAIDHSADRQFGVLAAAAPRVYTVRRFTGGPRVIIDDLMTTTNLVVKADDDANGTYERTLAATDYHLYPWNAAADGEPWTILFPAQGVSLPTCERGVEVTAVWGWTAVPDVVTRACLTQAGRFFKRRDAPFGVAGSLENGSEIRLLSRLDPDVAVMIASVRRYD